MESSQFTFDLPGFQNDFQPSEKQQEQLLRSRWNEDVNRLTERLLQNEPWNFTNQPALTDYYNPRTTNVPKGAAVVPITWTAYPNRIKYEIPGAGRRKHWEYADNGVPDPNYYPPGPRGWQDEYCEWSVTRNAEGQITKISFTSETREYWYALWDVAPNIVLRLYKQLVNEQVKLEDLYLRDKSGNPIIDPQTGRPAYDELNQWNRTTSGGLAHLIGDFNFQYGAMFLGAQSTILRKDEQGNPITDASQLVDWGSHATPNRNSDPFISARVNDLVRAGVKVTLKNPIGLYIQEPNFGTYELPFTAPDDAKPSDYWKVIRGRKRQAGENYDLILHAVYEVPAEHGFTVSDISIGGFPIEFGAQMAETLQVAVIGEGIPQHSSAYGRVGSNSLPYPAVLREVDLLKVAERSNLNMRIEQGTTIQNVALKARHSDRNASIEFVGAPGVTVNKTGFQEEAGSQIFLLTVTAAKDAPLGNRSLLLKNSDGAGGPARFGMLEVVSPGTLGVQKPVPVSKSILLFDGLDDYIGLGKKTEYNIEKQITLEAWIYVLSQREWAGIFSKIYDTGATESGYGLLLDGKSGVYFGLRVPPVGIQYLSSGADSINLSEWHHVAATYDGQQMKIYINGIERVKQAIGSATQANINYDPDNELSIGAYRDNNEAYYFNGKITEVRLWKVARTQIEIQQLMLTRLKGNESGLVGYWPVNEGVGNRIYNQIASSSPLKISETIQGATWQQEFLWFLDD